MKFTLEKPDLKNVKTEQVIKLLNAENKAEIFDFIKKFLNLEYIYWDDFRFKEPFPKGVSREELGQLFF